MPVAQELTCCMFLEQEGAMNGRDHRNPFDPPKMNPQPLQSFCFTRGRTPVRLAPCPHDRPFDAKRPSARIDTRLPRFCSPRPLTQDNETLMEALRPVMVFRPAAANNPRIRAPTNGPYDFYSGNM